MTIGPANYMFGLLYILHTRDESIINSLNINTRLYINKLTGTALIVWKTRLSILADRFFTGDYFELLNLKNIQWIINVMLKQNSKEQINAHFAEYVWNSILELFKFSVLTRGFQTIHKTTHLRLFLFFCDPSHTNDRHLF